MEDIEPQEGRDYQAVQADVLTAKMTVCPGCQRRQDLDEKTPKHGQ